MVSLPDSQDPVPQDVFHTPPEHSCDLPRAATAVDVDAGTQGLVDLCQGSVFADLGRDSDLGFSGVQVTQEKWKLSEVDLGVDCSGGCVEVQSQKVEEGEGNLVSEAEKPSCTVEGSKSSDGVLEGSGRRKNSDEERAVRALPPSLRGPLKIAASESECLKNAASGTEGVFDVFKVFSEISNEEEQNLQNLDNLSLWEVAEACGLTFPRPRWWPEGEDFDLEE